MYGNSLKEKLTAEKKTPREQFDNHDLLGVSTDMVMTGKECKGSPWKIA